MTKFEVGDRVRAVAKYDSNDTFEFTATRVTEHTVEARYNIFSYEYFTLTLLERPLPSTPGLYLTDTGGLRHLALAQDGIWYWLEFSSGDPEKARNGEVVSKANLTNLAPGLRLVYTAPLDD